MAMKCEDFLSNCGDVNLRKKICRLFEYAENEAKWFGSLRDNWVEIVSAEGAAETKWVPLSGHKAKILIQLEAEESYLLGGVFHEIFHSAFHDLPLSKYLGNYLWGDGFCEAFRYYMAKKNLLASDFMIKKFNEDSNKSDEEIISSGYKDWDIPYGITAYRIIKGSKDDYGNFKTLWENLNEDKLVNLDKYFNFSLEDNLKKYKIHPFNKSPEPTSS
jgi:hypothetical protein